MKICYALMLVHKGESVTKDSAIVRRAILMLIVFKVNYIHTRLIRL